MQALARPMRRGLDPMVHRDDRSRRTDARAQRLRASVVILCVGIAFSSIGVQLTRLASQGSASSGIMVSLNEPIARTFARPDIVDRKGLLLATDVELPSLYADPSLVQSRDEVAETLPEVLTDLNPDEIRRLLADKSRRFTWLRRGLSPKLAQAVHNLGLPGLAFRDELKRAYPLERVAGHIMGTVDVDNRGVSGLERYIDETHSAEAVHAATLTSKAPLRLSIDLGVQHAVEAELKDAMARYDAKGAAGLVMDVATGEMIASASLPGIDPSRPGEQRDPERLDRIEGGVYELGSIWKAVTIADALETGKATLDRIIDVTQPLTAGRYTITDTHPAGRPLTVAEIFTHSSNVGAGMLALEIGADRQKAFLEKLGLWTDIRTEAGPVASPLLPKQLERAEQITISYGHGIAVAPIQFAAAAASLINGGTRVTPTYLAGAERPKGERVVSEATSKLIADLFRLNVTDAHGTGKRADASGYRVGGKTGTAEIPGRGGYREKAVIASFLAAFPMDAPKYLVLVSLFEPKANEETNGEITGGRNAAPTVGRIVSRVGPLLGILPKLAQN